MAVRNVRLVITDANHDVVVDAVMTATAAALRAAEFIATIPPPGAAGHVGRIEFVAVPGPARATAGEATESI